MSEKSITLNASGLKVSYVYARVSVCAFCCCQQDLCACRDPIKSILSETANNDINVYKHIAANIIEKSSRISGLFLLYQYNAKYYNNVGYSSTWLQPIRRSLFLHTWRDLAMSYHFIVVSFICAFNALKCTKISNTISCILNTLI